MFISLQAVPVTYKLFVSDPFILASFLQTKFPLRKMYTLFLLSGVNFTSCNLFFRQCRDTYPF